MSWSVDRLGRSLQHLVEFLGDIQHKGVEPVLSSAEYRHQHTVRESHVILPAYSGHVVKRLVVPQTPRG